MQTSLESIERLLLDAIAVARRIDPAGITRSTPLLDTHIDSLTLVTVLSQIEIAYGLTFDTDDVTQMLRARDIAELGESVSRKLESIR